MSSLAGKLLAIHGRLEAVGVAHAFGGAFALAFHTGEPRATIDIDVNVFVPEKLADPILQALSPEVSVSARQRSNLRQDGQVRLFWADTPIDVFFSTVPFHSVAAARAEMVTFAGDTIPILSAVDLAVCKTVYSRDKDWADLRAMKDAGTVDVEETLVWVRDILGPDSHNEARLTALFNESSQATPPQIPISPPKGPRGPPSRHPRGPRL